MNDNEPKKKEGGDEELDDFEVEAPDKEKGEDEDEEDDELGDLGKHGFTVEGGNDFKETDEE